ncbi:ATP-binding protein [Streptomyces sp. NPDC050703]|uniref:sensor histidine kinase n=1 Tax=Streptomyces sp. NPDC050703 TaxID=3157218 RepID=UPI0034224B1D
MTAPTPLARPGTNGASPGPAQSGARASAPLRPSALVLLICALVTAALTATAVVLAPASVRAPLAWGAGAAALALSVAVAAAFHGARTASLLRRQLDAAHQEMGRLAHEQARHAAESGQERTRLTDRHAREVAALTAEHVRERTALTLRVRAAESERAAALAASANAAGRMQALATGMLADLREMEGRHADEDVLTDLLHLDHRTAQAGRIADSVAVLTGARSGRRWARPIVMESILRGAMGRIGGYQRVRVHSASEVAVAGHAAEGVMHALAEILDNAANFSPPTSEVHVYIEEVAAGVIISVEDSGLVMGPVQQRRAEQAVSGEAKGLSGLSGTRLGLAVVGRLTRKHGLTVSFRPSARGGTGVLLLIPQELLTRPSEAVQVPAAAPASPSAAELPAAQAAPAQAGDPGSHSSPDRPSSPGSPANPPHTSAPSAPSAPLTPSSEDTAVLTPVDREPLPAHESAAAPPAGRPAEAPLPKRPRGRTLAAAERARADSDTGETPRPRTADAATTAARFSSFRQAVRVTPSPSGTDAPAPSPHPEGDTPR